MLVYTRHYVQLVEFIINQGFGKIEGKLNKVGSQNLTEDGRCQKFVKMLSF